MVSSFNHQRYFLKNVIAEKKISILKILSQANDLSKACKI